MRRELRQLILWFSFVKISYDIKYEILPGVLVNLFPHANVQGMYHLPRPRVQARQQKNELFTFLAHWKSKVDGRVSATSCVCRDRYICLHVCVEVSSQPQGLFLRSHPPCFLSVSSVEPRACWLARPTDKPQGSTCLCLSNTEITDARHHTQLSFIVCYSTKANFNKLLHLFLGNK